MTAWLKQSTAVTLLIGPFLDETDGKTAETGLTVSQADVRLSKNGGNMAQKHESTACTHDEIGMYTCKLDTTDTNTLGILQVCVHESGALPVFATYMVVPANVWDSMFGADMLKVDVHSIDDDETAADNLEAACDNYSATRGLAGTALPDAAADAAGGLPISDAGGLDLDTYIKRIEGAITATILGRIDAAISTRSSHAASDVKTAVEAAGSHLALIKAKTDNLPASPAAVGSAMTLADDAITAAKFDESTAFPLKSADTGATAVARTGADSDTLKTLSDEIAAVTAPTAAAVADAVWDEAVADHAGVGSTGAALAAAGGSGDPWATALPGAYGAGTAGKIVGDNLNATVSSRSSHDAAAVKTAIEAAGSHLALIKAKTDNLPTDPADDSDIDTQLATIAGYLDTEIAAILAAVDTEVAAIKAKTDNLPASPAATGAQMDLIDAPNATALTALAVAILDTLLSEGDADALNARTVRSALRALRNKSSIAAGVLTVCKENDSDSAWTGAVTTDGAAEPITVIDPT